MEKPRGISKGPLRFNMFEKLKKEKKPFYNDYDYTPELKGNYKPVEIDHIELNLINNMQKV